MGYFLIAVGTEDPLEFQSFYRKLQELPEVIEIDYILDKSDYNIMIQTTSASESTAAIIKGMKYFKDISEVGEEFKKNFKTVSLI